MGKATGFLDYERVKPNLRPVQTRLRDFREIVEPPSDATLHEQAARCMDCGIPFCHQACPLGNLIPDWNDATYQNAWPQALHALHATNNFPEFTGRVCPAPCEAACVLSIEGDAVTIKSVELSIIERGFADGVIVARPPAERTGKRVAVVGSGPAGLAAAAQLNSVGHTVVIYERADRIGGLLRYGIPDFKLEKRVLDRRLALLQEEGIVFVAGVDVGRDLSSETLRAEHDAVLLAVGATRPRSLDVPGNQLAGVVPAMDYLSHQNRRVHTPSLPIMPLYDAAGRDVVIVGGGDTGADCLGTAHRQGARSVVQLEIHPEPPLRRASDNPWPTWPHVLRMSPAHEEGGQRRYSIATAAFLGDAQGHVRALQIAPMPGTKAPEKPVRDRGDAAARPVDQALFAQPIDAPGTELPCTLALLAIGFAGVDGEAGAASFAVARTPRGSIARDAQWMTNIPGVFTAGDAQRGQSLIVWAMADGRSAARAIDMYLMGTSALPAPV